MKNIFIYALIAICIILTVREYQRYRTNKIAVHSKSSSSISMEAEEVAREVDKEGREHVIYKEAEPILNLIEVRVEDRDRVDSLLNLANVREKNLQAISTVYAEVREENIVLKKQVNTILKDTAYIYTDKWLDLSFKKKDDTIAIGSFRYNFDFNTITYNKRKWFLGTKHSYTDIFSSDPRATIRGYDKITIKQPISQYGMKLQASTRFYPITKDIGYGTSMRLATGRFSISGDYIYYPSEKKWIPSIGGNFDIFRF